MKVLVYGAGVIGGQLAHALIKGGNDVTVIARGAWKETLERDGLRIHHYIQRNDTVDHPRILEKPDGTRYDAVFVHELLVKINDLVFRLVGFAVCPNAVFDNVRVVPAAERDPEPGAAVVRRHIFRRFPVKIFDQGITDIAVCLFQRRENCVAVFFIEGSCHITGGSKRHDPTAFLSRDALDFADDHRADPVMPIAFIHPKRVKEHSRPAVFVSFRNTSADDLAVFVLDLEDEFFFISIYFVRHDFIDLLADICGVFFCQILDFVFLFFTSSYSAAGIAPRRCSVSD